MKLEPKLKQKETHFAFGKNWRSYSRLVNSEAIESASEGLIRLLGDFRLENKSFLDIGCGSGLHCLAAMRLGCNEVVAIDIDYDSVVTARELISKYASESCKSSVQELSVFHCSDVLTKGFDVVYSWGVLHHTGSMNEAIAAAAEMVDKGGIFIFALYRRTWMDWFWKIEKRWYAKATDKAQRRAQSIFIFLFKIGLVISGRSYREYLNAYSLKRGMDFSHDVHDWMGGWPYESIQPSEVDLFMRRLGFEKIRVFSKFGASTRRYLGIFGSGCDEYVYRRIKS